MEKGHTFTGTKRKTITPLEEILINTGFLLREQCVTSYSYEYYLIRFKLYQRVSPSRTLSCKTSFTVSVSFQEKIMQSTRRHSYDLNFKLKIVEEAEAVKN